MRIIFAIFAFGNFAKFNKRYIMSSRKFHLKAEIRRKIRPDGVWYLLTIDGDEFWKETYRDAVKCLVTLCLRDEL